MLETIKYLNRGRRGPGVHLLLAYLVDKINGKVTQEDLYEFCLRWTYYYALNELEYHSLPVPNDDVASFQRLTEQKQRKIMSEDSDIRGKVLAFRGRYMAARYANKVRKDWLERMLKYYYRIKDTEKINKIEEVRRTYGEGKTDTL